MSPNPSTLPSAVPDTLQGVETLATVLQQSGYDTAAFVDGGLMLSQFGHDAGFDVYVDDLATGEGLAG